MIMGATEDTELECLEGSASVVIVVYLDEEFDPDVCEACNVDDLADMGGSHEFCAYYVEIPCDTISVECGSPSPASPSSSPKPEPTGKPSSPTDCSMPAPPKIFDSVCMTTGGEVMDPLITMPSNAIVITHQKKGDYLGFTVSQEWVDKAGLAVRSSLDDCIVRGNMFMGDTEDIEVECLEGIKTVVIVVYFDQEFDPDVCEACNVDDLADMGGSHEFCAYYVEIPCDTISVECEGPSADFPS